MHLAKMMEMTGIESNNKLDERLDHINEGMDDTMDDTEEGEILEDGEIADEEEVEIEKKDNEVKTEEKENNSHKDKDKEKDSNTRDRDSRKKDDNSRKSDENKCKDKDRDRNRDRDRDKDKDKDRDRRHGYDRNERSDRERKSADRDRKTSNEEERDKRRVDRRDRDRKRRRSEDEEERDKRKRSREQTWDYNESNNTTRTTFEDYDRRFEDFDFRINDPSFAANTVAVHQSSDDEEFTFDDRDFEEMMQIMETRIPTNRMMGSNDGMPSNEKRAMMRAMALMMKRNLNLDSDKGRRLARLRDKRRTRDRTPGPTGTRAVTRQTERTERTTAFKPICKFFIEGKCHKGSDCSYSHETSPTKKKEICKFYLQGFCGKGEECLFMHNEFPCKFFHTNVECYSGENCRFSHSPLNEETRQILRNYLDSGQLPDDPKPDRHESQTKNDNIRNEDNNTNTQLNNNNNNNNNVNNNSQMTTNSQLSSTYTPMKPVAKRHAILGDPTKEMKTSYYTWVWQQEMKELEVAYVGNKRNLFCIESKFAITEKPSTPRMEDDEEEIEAQIRSYYMETMGNFESEEIEETKPVVKTEEQRLIEASAHDEDLRTLLMRPKAKANQTIDSNIKELSSEEQEDKSQLSSESSLSPAIPQTTEVGKSLPKVSRDLFVKMQNKIQSESESKSSWLSDSDDDDKDEHVLAAALKNVQQKSNPKSSPEKSKRSIDISKMLSAIRQSSNTNQNAVTKQSEFWQNILSGIHLAGSSPSGNNTPPRNDYRDPRLKRPKDSMSPSVETTPPVKICDPNVIIEYKLIPVTVTDIDYSCYVSIYRIDSRLKNDPRLQKFFAKLPTSEIDNLSRIVPPPLKTAPVTPLSVLKSKKKIEKEKRDKKVKANSPTLPPLPPLTISPSKSTPTPGIIPPTPPPIMSPLELISSRPTFTVGDNKSSNITKEENKIDIKSSPQSAHSPEPYDQSDSNDKPTKVDTKYLSNILPPSLNQTLVTTEANPLSSNTFENKNKEILCSSPPPLTSTSLSSMTLTTELYECSFRSNLTNTELEKDEESVSPQTVDTTCNNSTDDDLYDNMYAPTTDSSKTGQQYSADSSPSLIEDELEMIRNELQAPVIDSDPEMEIDMRERKDSVSEVESADECELMIASSSETEDNNNDFETNNTNENTLMASKDLIPSNNHMINEPINLTISENSDQSLKSVFSTIDPTASPFC